METKDRLSDLEWRLRYHKVMINVLALLVLASVGSRVWEQFSGPGELTVTSLSVVDAEGNKLVSLGATTNGEGIVWTTTKSGRVNRLD
jgi:hypothetical protein